MPTELTDIELRVLGCLIEKERATPDYYPLTLNALVNACNQKSNRDPVVSYTEAEVEATLNALLNADLVYIFYGSGSRTPKYKHLIPRVFELSEAETAIMCVLMLRGSQTLGELNQRTTRLFEFDGIAGIAEAMSSLTNRDEPLAVKLPVAPGQKEARYQHMLGSEVQVKEPVAETIREATTRASNEEDRISKLENEVAELRQEFERFRRQFE